MKSKIALMFLILVMALSACAPAATPPPAQVSVEPTAAPVQATDVPTAEPTAAPAEPEKLILATTTSTQDSGLLEFLLPDFENEFNAKIDVVAVGTGQAIQLGKDGNADVLLVHARSQEDAFMEGGDGIRREDVMYNDFVIVGPESDPAKIKGITSAVDAFKAIADSKAKFISRGDKSGTNTKELAIWKTAGIEPAGDWYISAGQGMGAVLTMSDEQQAYTLSDRATYLAQTQKGLQLNVLVEGDVILFNPYGVIAVNPNKNSQIKNDLANKFIDWLISVPVQEKIKTFGEKDFGQPLFIPDSKPYRDSMTPAAGLKITGSVTEPQAWTEEQVKALPTMDVEATNSKGEKAIYTGVELKVLLDIAKLNADATTLTFVANDGYSVDAPLADLAKCEKCIVSFRSNGGFSSVFPDLPKNFQVKGLVEIQVK